MTKILRSPAPMAPILLAVGLASAAEAAGPAPIKMQNVLQHPDHAISSGPSFKPAPTAGDVRRVVALPPAAAGGGGGPHTAAGGGGGPHTAPRSAAGGGGGPG